MSPDHVIAEARGWIGTPYRHQAATKGAGTDCLGLVRGIWRALYGFEAGPVPPYGRDWRDCRLGTLLQDAAMRHLVEKSGPPRPGDVVLFALLRHRPARHCGVMVGPGVFIHAQEGIGVTEMALSDAWARRIAGVFAFP